MEPGRQPSGTPPAGAPAPSTLFPRLRWFEWGLFALLACVMAATNIYTSLLIGWSDTGAIISALLSVLVLGGLSARKPHIFTINLGQTMASAGGAVGFAVATYACVRIADPGFSPPTWLLIPLFAAMGVFGALTAATVRPMMVKYFFPTGTACAVIQRTVTRELAPGEPNRPIFLLKLWGTIAALYTIPTKIALEKTAEGARALLSPITLWRDTSAALGERVIALGVEPLFFGIGLVVGPRVGVGMLLGGLAAPFVLQPMLAGTPELAQLLDWKRWLAIAVLTLPTFATIGLALKFRTPAVVPPGFTPGRTAYRRPERSRGLWIALVLASGAAIAVLAQQVFDLPAYASLVTMIVAWPMCIVNGRVNGETDINPVRLVAIVLLASLTWMIAGASAIALLGMALIGGTMASVAVDLFQDYRTGHLLDADPVHMTTVQVIGACIGACAAIPVLDMLIASQGLGEGSNLPAPGAQIWASMGIAMAGGFHPSDWLLHAIYLVSAAGCAYAFLTVWPVTAAWMPSLFGIGIGMLLPIDNSMGIFAGGLLHWLLFRLMVRGATPEARATSGEGVRNDMMLAGSAIFAAAAVMSILLVIAVEVLARFDRHPFFIAG